MDRLNAVTNLKKRFLTVHLGRWIEPFTEAVKGGAESVFYPQLAELTKLFVRMETNKEGVDCALSLVEGGADEIALSGACREPLLNRFPFK